MRSRTLKKGLVDRVRLGIRRIYENRKEGRIDVLDQCGGATGETRNIYDIHSEGHWHKTANVYVVNSKGDVLLQQRSMKMRTFPGLWTMSAGGHLRAGQDSRTAALEELKEELGIDTRPEDLVQIGSSQKDELLLDGTNIDKEFQDNFVLHRDIDLDDIRHQKHEVGGVMWMPIEEYRSKVLSRDTEHVMHASLPKFFEYIDGSNKN